MACTAGFFVGDLCEREHYCCGECPHPHVRLETDDRDDQDQDRRQREPVRGCQLGCCRERGGVGRLASTSAEQPGAAEGEISDSSSERIGQQIRQEDLSLEARHAHSSHQLTGDDPGRCDRREGSGHAAVRDHERHQERGDAGRFRDGHRQGRDQGGGRDVSRPDRCDA